MSYRNYGVLPEPEDNKHWIAGAIPFENRNPEGDWRGPKYMVVGEVQAFPTFDTMSCVSYATNNSKEMQLKPQLGYEVNLNDQFLAVMSGTTQQGNRVSTVLDTDRHYGSILQADWITNPKTWAEWNTRPSQELIDKGIASLKLYEMQYEYIPDHSIDTIAHHLHHAPLLTTIPGHEIDIVAPASSTEAWVLDTYRFNMDPSNPYLRKINIKDITDIFKAVWTVKELRGPMKIVNDNGTYFLVGEKAKMGLNGIESLNFFRRLTDKEETGSTANIPQIGVFENQLGIDLD